LPPGCIEWIAVILSRPYSHATPPWRHVPEREERVHLPAVDGKQMAFERAASPGYESAELVLFGRSDGLEVTNIVPLQLSELSHRAYNTILEDFAEQIARPAANSTGFVVELSGSTEQIEDKLLEACTRSDQESIARARRSSARSALDQNILDRI